MRYSLGADLFHDQCDNRKLSQQLLRTVRALRPPSSRPTSACKDPRFGPVSRARELKPHARSSVTPSVARSLCPRRCVCRGQLCGTQKSSFEWPYRTPHVQPEQMRTGVCPTGTLARRVNNILHALALLRMSGVSNHYFTRIRSRVARWIINTWSFGVSGFACMGCVLCVRGCACVHAPVSFPRCCYHHVPCMAVIAEQYSRAVRANPSKPVHVHTGA